MELDFSHIFLLGLLVFSNIYWAFINQKMVNKLMSRNYAEYLQSENMGKPKKRENTVLETDPVYIKEQQRIADNANSMMGII